MSKTSLFGKITNLIYPTDCLGCGLEGEWLCSDCLKRHRKIRLENCFICARAAALRQAHGSTVLSSPSKGGDPEQSLPRAESSGRGAENGICRKCQAQTGLDGIISLLPYHLPESKGLIYSSKYYGYHQSLAFVAEYFAGKIARKLPEEIGHIAFVPMTRPKLRERGFNPAELVAKRLATAIGLETAEMFEKIRETKSQTKLTKSKRRENVRKTFSLAIRRPPERLVIADDVITTGSTLGALAKLAKRRGAKEVWAVTICHG